MNTRSFGRPVTASRYRSLDRTPAKTVLLARGTVWTVAEAGRGGTIACVSGRCWLTRAGDAADYLLTPGETFPTGARGAVVIQALTDAELRVD